MKKILLYTLIILGWLTHLYGCVKKPTRSLPRFSLEYNGTYYESNEIQNIRKYAYADSFGYYLAVPIEKYYLQIRMQTGTLATGQTPVSTCGTMWYYSTTYTACNWNVHLTSVSTTATGTFNGTLVNNTDTIQITNGNFLNINIQ